MTSIYTKGTRVWLPDSTAGWIPGTVTAVSVPADGDDKSQVIISVAVDGVAADAHPTTRDYKCSLAAFRAAAEPNSTLVSSSSLNPGQEALPPLRNPPLLESSEDLASLSNLNEPSGVPCH